MRKMFGSSGDKAQVKSEEEMDLIIESLARVCSTTCSASTSDSIRHSRQHMIRANVRDAEGRRFVFVCDEEEAWKIANAVQRLRKGSQARQLAVEGMGTAEASLIMTNLRTL